MTSISLTAISFWIEIKKVVEISLRNNDFLDLSGPQINELVKELVSTYSRNKTELSFQEFHNMVSNATGVIEAFDIDTDRLCEN